MARIIGPSGIEMDIDETVAAGLVDGGHARYVTEAPEESDAAPEDFGETVDAADSATADVDEAASDTEKPKGNASVEVWTAYAIAQGKDVAGLSRDEIRALFKD